MTDHAPLPPRNERCVLYLIRHGATQNNLAKPPLLQGSGANPDLSAEGHQQAEKTALQLAHLPIHAVYSSPLNRAMQTGSPIAQSHGVPCQSLPGLIEVDVGRWQDRHWEEIATNEPEAYENFIRDPATYPYAEGETFEDVSRRIQPVFVQLLERHLGQSIVVIGHNVVNRVFLAHVANIPLAKSREIRQTNCGINVIYHRKQKNQLVTMNAAFHLLKDQ
ncbi:MAG: hypothetical protein CBB70_02615 [Planctomycetaceae bacterium TMED10]|nr:MAG: hypothetical protein CBB70_02615 [Planctomycetaceae bacterium TMED10]